MSASEQVDPARHEFRVDRRDESPHADCTLPVTPLSELLMHEDAQLG